MSIPKDESQLQNLLNECKGLVKMRSLLSAGASAVPVIGIDAVADLINMSDTLNAINRKFGLAPNQIDGLTEAQKVGFQAAVSASANKLIVTYVTIGLLKAILAKLGIKIATKNVVKWVPIIGSLISAGIGYAAFSGFCNSHIDDCERAVRAIWDTDNEPPPKAA